MPRYLPALARASFRTLERLAPALGARWALRLWLTPPHAMAGRSPARHPNPSAGERFTVSLDGGSARRRSWGATGGRIVAETWGSGPAVYLLHGWGGSRSHLAALVPPLVAAGMQVVTLDAPGHGESGPGHLGGRRTTLPEIADALTAVTAVAGPPHAVISHSGGCAAAGIALWDGLAPERLVFVAPMADPTPMLGQFARLLGLGPRTEQRFLRRLERVAGRELAEFDLPARAAAADKLPALLVIHDRDDKELQHAHGEAIVDAWPGSRLVTTTGLGHRRLLADPEVIKTVVGHVTAADA